MWFRSLLALDDYTRAFLSWLLIVQISSWVERRDKEIVFGGQHCVFEGGKQVEVALRFGWLSRGTGSVRESGARDVQISTDCSEDETARRRWRRAPSHEPPSACRCYAPSARVRRVIWARTDVGLWRASMPYTEHELTNLSTVFCRVSSQRSHHAPSHDIVLGFNMAFLQYNRGLMGLLYY